MDTERLLHILLIGNGGVSVILQPAIKRRGLTDVGREHALAWKLSQSPRCEKLYVAPGNGGTGQIFKVENVPDLQPNNFAGLLAFAKESRVNLVVVGPEAPLVAGIESTFRGAGIPFFGPSEMAARMERHSIPTAKYRNFSVYEDAKKYLDEVPYQVVLKATGIAAGKGVIIPMSKDHAHAALKEIMVEKEFGSAGDEVVIEEHLTGQELSFLSFVDGYTIKSLPPAEDHKRIFDNDRGPNTGGMGCYTGSHVATKKLIGAQNITNTEFCASRICEADISVEEVQQIILQPTIDGMRAERNVFKGLLFTGIMVTSSGPKVLEYNTRFGDPETQTLLPLMESDLVEVILACIGGYLDTVDVSYNTGFSSVTVVACSGGYPGSYKTGEPITIASGLPKDTNSQTYIFHAGTLLSSGTLKTAGGRVIAATAVASTLETAIANAYSTISTITFPGMHYRRDIAHRALAPASSSSFIPPAKPSSAHKPNGLTYASSGVSITNGNTLVSTIKPLVASTNIPGSVASIGSFGGPFDLHLAGYPNGPRLVSGMDGVGTKLRIAQRMNKHDTIGIDLVAMCVNDILCEGATPFQFMDTYSCNKLDLDVATEVIKGIVNGCKEAKCALIGGETAEMGDVYREGEYDLVGSTTGAIAYGKPSLPRKEDMRIGDVVLGLASSGCHSNGFSLIQKIVEKSGLRYTDPAPWIQTSATATTIGTELLVPTRIYVTPLLQAIERNLIKGAAHITGGGLLENVPRCLPSHLAAELDSSAWEVPGVFRWLKQVGQVDAVEMARVFNIGIGMVVVVAKEDVEAVKEVLEGAGEKVMGIGTLVERGTAGAEKKEAGCIIKGLEMWV
ncbi:MAG: hypothetical protein Q9209_002900 [Squamulea sp. 1 TL-2023]